jgi:hypothetical protein
VGQPSAKRAELKRQAPMVRIALVVRRAHREFRCEGLLGDWDGRCGYCILAGEGYVQSGERRLCLACAEIEAKQVANAERAFACALFAGVRQALAERVGNTWNVGTSACSWSTGKDFIQEDVEGPHYRSGSMSAAQALVSENEQLAKFARSQETITRILEEPRTPRRQ